MAAQKMPDSDEGFCLVTAIARVVCAVRGHHWRQWAMSPYRGQEYRDCLRCWKREERAEASR